jgi:superfamily II DNA/RNA helicase
MIKDSLDISTILSSIGFTSLNDPQEETLQKSQENHNVMILSQTGSRKTFAFLLPLFLRLDVKKKMLTSK